ASHPLLGYTIIIISSVLLLFLILLGMLWPRISHRFFSKKETE
ncbi:EscJ/YscJ/HrcJ family type III secretion inner membrane ring protein, partial [Citrobacter freundii]